MEAWGWVAVAGGIGTVFAVSVGIAVAVVSSWCWRNLFRWIDRRQRGRYFRHLDKHGW